jgi:F420-0:gamma-glutamyl ligase-like protein
MTKLIIAFRKFAKAHKKDNHSVLHSAQELLKSIMGNKAIKAITDTTRTLNIIQFYFTVIPTEVITSN